MALSIRSNSKCERLQTKANGRLDPLSLVVVLVSLLSFCAIPSAIAMDISIVNDRITLHADAVPLSSILAVLVNEGVVIRISPDIDPRITASLENQPLHFGLKSILHPYSFALTWKKPSGDSGKNFRLAGIQIFEEGSRSKMQYLKPENDFVVLENVSKEEKYVKGEVLVRITARGDIKQLEQLLAGVQGRIIKENVSTGLYRIQVADDTDINALVGQINSELPGAAEPNFVYELNIPEPHTQPSVTADTSIRENNTTSKKNTGGTVAILDSGLTAGQGIEPFVVTSLNPINTGEPLTDTLGHGTQMAMLATGMVTPIGGAEAEANESVSIIPIKIFNDQGLTTNFTLIESVDFALENNASIISLSWGTETKSDFLEQSMQQADAAGAIVLAAAGNEPTGVPVYPAAYDTVIGVGALGIDGNPWEKSNYGDFVTVYAPGMALFPQDSNDLSSKQSYAGTSISTAYIAGVLSTFIAENPDASKDEIIEEVKSTVGLLKVPSSSNSSAVMGD